MTDTERKRRGQGTVADNTLQKYQVDQSFSETTTIKKPPFPSILKLLLLISMTKESSARHFLLRLELRCNLRLSTQPKIQNPHIRQTDIIPIACALHTDLCSRQVELYSSSATIALPDLSLAWLSSMGIGRTCLSCF